MLDFSKHKKNCTGCSACYNACPLNCIEMKQDEEGFLYPEATSACIHCGICEKVCPIKNEHNFHSKETFLVKAYCTQTKSTKVWRRSASGGAFSEICRVWDNGNTVICGAAWNGFSVHHMCVQGFKQIEPLCNSKYMESSVGDVFTEIKSFLDVGKRVVFCGTPCQVAGLKSFLGKQENNLLLVDLICHGVGSPFVFKECVKALSRQFGGEILSYKFRAKRKNILAEKKGDVQTYYINNDQYIQLFLSQNCLRPSCGENCRFRNEQRQGDITIADFKKLTEVFPNLKGVKKNYSSIIVNNEKGMMVIEQLKNHMQIHPCKIDDIKKHNPLFYRQTVFSKNRDTFFKEFLLDAKKSIEKWTNPAESSKRTYKRLIIDALPICVRKVIFMATEKITKKKIDISPQGSSCSNSKITVRVDRR